MREKENFDKWGLSLSLRPPIDHLAKKPCKRESHFLIDEQSTNTYTRDRTPMMVPRMMEVDVKPPFVIDSKEMEISKMGFVNSTLEVESANRRRPGVFTGGGDAPSDEEEGGSGSGGGNSSERGERKKLRLSKEHIMVLEQAFSEHTTLNTRQKVALARQVSLSPRQVEVWFQNRRARTKLKQTEVDCEYLRRYCETLTEQNKKLQKEVQELRELKITHGYKNQPATSLNMCPSCKSVSVFSSSPSTTNKTSATKTRCYLTEVLHRPVPLKIEAFLGDKQA